jgi:replicative DNA helicase
VDAPRQVEQPAPDGKEWLSMQDIGYLDLKNLSAIPTGHEAFDRKALGFILGEISIVSGLNGSGKSSWLNCITLNAIQRGFKVAMFSGELMKEKVKTWLNQVAAGREFVKKVYGYDDFYYVPKDVTAKIDEWTKDKIFLYDNKYGRNWSRLLESIRNVVEKKEVNLLILDNLMTLDLDAFGGDKNEKQSAFVNSLADLAKQANIHIILVAHPRKSLTFLRREDIGGSGDITNLADNVYIIHRVNKDFVKRAPEFLGNEDVTKIVEYDGFSNVVEVCKNRFVGSVDNIFGYYYESETKRFMQDKTEHVVYGWNPPVIQQDMDFERFTGINENEWSANEFDDDLPL